MALDEVAKMAKKAIEVAIVDRSRPEDEVAPRLARMVTDDPDANRRPNGRNNTAEHRALYDTTGSQCLCSTSE